MVSDGDVLESHLLQAAATLVLGLSDKDLVSYTLFFIYERFMEKTRQ